VKPAEKGGIEAGFRRVFPRHHLQDEFMHLGTIVAFVVAVVGLVLGLFPQVAYIGQTALLFSIALFLFLILRESTLSHVRSRRHLDEPSGETRYHAQRSDRPASQAGAEAATAESAPPGSAPRP
jgi:hypothetical protein